MYIDRDITGTFERQNEVQKMIAVVGPRQSGKTTFLQHMMRGRSANYILFDEPVTRALFESDLKRFDVQHLAGHDVTVLDEVQHCEGAGSRLKYLVDTGRRLWITASSEIILCKEVLGFLVGRVGIVRLYPFDLGEFMRAKGLKVSTPSIVKDSVLEHMTYGGYPQSVFAGSSGAKLDFLKDLFTTMILKDVARTFSIEDLDALENLARYLAATPGAIVEYKSLETSLGITYKTLRKYLDALERGYLIRSVPPFSTNRAKEIVKQPKMYFLDNGLRNAVLGEFHLEADGRAFENYVLTELVKMGFEPRHWRTKGKNEVDFVIRRGAEVVPIEVKLTASPGEVERGLHTFISTYKSRVAFVVYLNGSRLVKKVGGCSVAFVDVEGLWESLGHPRQR